jgi:hypothetical protein
LAIELWACRFRLTTQYVHLARDQFEYLADVRESMIIASSVIDGFQKEQPIEFDGSNKFCD